MTQSTRQLTQEDVPVGQPLPFPLADSMGRLLLPMGAVVPDAEDVRLLFHHGPVLALARRRTMRPSPRPSRLQRASRAWGPPA